MSRPRKQTPFIAKYRMNRGFTTEEIAKEAQMSEATVLRMERGQAISRVFVAKYCKLLDIDLNNPATIPAGIEIIDLEEKIKILSTQQ